jgi:transcriptional regulator with XRE-family HTH domain
MSSAQPPSDEDKASIRGLGLAVERLRQEQGLSREQVAERGELPAATVGEIEDAEIDREPRWGDLRRVAKGLEVELDYLIRLSYEMAPGPAGDRLRESEREKG